MGFVDHMTPASSDSVFNLKEGRMKCYTKYKVNATNCFVAIAQNRVISEFLVLKIHLSNTVET